MFQYVSRNCNISILTDSFVTFPVLVNGNQSLPRSYRGEVLTLWKRPSCWSHIKPTPAECIGELRAGRKTEKNRKFRIYWCQQYTANLMNVCTGVKYWLQGLRQKRTPLKTAAWKSNIILRWIAEHSPAWLVKWSSAMLDHDHRPRCFIFLDHRIPIIALWFMDDYGIWLIFLRPKACRSGTNIHATDLWHLFWDIYVDHLIKSSAAEDVSSSTSPCIPLRISVMCL